MPLTTLLLDQVESILICSIWHSEQSGYISQIQEGGGLTALQFISHVAALAK